MGHILSAGWFQRLWTFQEIVLAQKAVLICGHQWIDFEHLLTVVGVVEEQGQRPAGLYTLFRRAALIECYSIQTYRKFRGIGNIGVKALPVLLEDTQKRHVQEEVDRIWALFGLFHQDTQTELAPLVDYSESARRNPWSTLVACYAVILTKSSSLQLLGLASTSVDRPPSLPTWCPNIKGRGNHLRRLAGTWNKSARQSLRLRRRSLLLLREDENTAKSRYDAIERHPKKYISAASRESCIRIRGFSLDTISEVVQEPGLLGAWDYIQDFATSAENFSLDNHTHRLALS